MALTEQQRVFIRGIVSGDSQLAAYHKAYPGAKRSSANSAAARLSKRKDVQDEIQALRAVATSEAVLSLRQKREYLARVVRTPICEVDEKSDLCQERSVSERGGGVRIKMPSKLRAIELDAKLAGELRETEGELTNTINIVIGAGELMALQEGYRKFRGECLGRYPAAAGPAL